MVHNGDCVFVLSPGFQLGFITSLPVALHGPYRYGESNPGFQDENLMS